MTTTGMRMIAAKPTIERIVTHSTECALRKPPSTDSFQEDLLPR